MLLSYEGLGTKVKQGFDVMWPKTEGASELSNIFPWSQTRGNAAAGSRNLACFV